MLEETPSGVRSHDRRHQPRMHTLRTWSSAAPRVFQGATSGCTRAFFLLVLLLLASGAFGSLHAQPSFPGSGSGVGVNLRVYPFDVWGPRVGPGIGAGLVVHNAGRSHARWLLTAAPALHEQVGTLSFASANPDRADQYVLVSLRGLHTDRRWFYGLGPASDVDTRLSFRQHAARAQVRLGQALWQRRLRVEPHATLQHVRTTGVTGNRSALSPRSATHVRRLLGSGPPGARQTGMRVGGTLRLEAPAPRSSDRAGVTLQTTWDRYLDLSGSELAFDQWDVEVRGVVPLQGQHRLALHAGLVRTWSRDDAPVPFYQRPTLDGSLVPGWPRSRFVGADRVATSIRYRFPLINEPPLFRLGGHVGLHAASIYDNVTEQFAAALAFDRTRDVDATTYPLQPSASLGVSMEVPMRPRTQIEFAVGISPEGLSAARLTMHRPLLLLRPPHHLSRSLR